MAPAACEDGFGKLTKGICDYCSQEADAELADCVSLTCRLGEKCHGEGRECDIYHRACIDKFMRSHCRLIDIERTCGWPCPKGKGKTEGHSCTGKVQWMKPLIIKNQKQAKAQQRLAVAALQTAPPAPKAAPKPKLNDRPIKRAPAPPQQIRFTPILDQPKPDPLGRKLGNKDVEGPAELPPGFVLSDMEAAKAAKAAKKNAKRNAKKKASGEGGEGRSEAGSQSMSSEALQQLPDAPARINPEHAAMMGGGAFVTDVDAFKRMFGRQLLDDSSDDEEQYGYHDTGADMDRRAYEQSMAQAVSPASDGWATSAAAGSGHGAGLHEAALAFLQAQGGHQGAQLGALLHAVDEEEPGADTATLEAALQASMAMQQRQEELAAQEEADVAAALAASRHQGQQWQAAAAHAPVVAAVAEEEDEDAALRAALAASLAEEQRLLEEARRLEASYAAAQAAAAQQEAAARAAALRAQQEAAREAALAAAQQPTYATHLPVAAAPFLSAAPVMPSMAAAAVAGQLQAPAVTTFMPAKAPLAAVPASLPWLAPAVVAPTAPAVPAPFTAYPFATAAAPSAGGQEEEDDDLDLEELKGLLVGAC